MSRPASRETGLAKPRRGRALASTREGTADTADSQYSTLQVQ